MSTSEPEGAPPPGPARPRKRGDAAASGALFGAASGCVGSVLFVMGLGASNPTGGLSATEEIAATLAAGLVLGMFGAVIAAPYGAGAGAVLGVLNFVIARTPRGQGWRAVFAVGLGLAALVSAPLVLAGGLGGVYLVPGMAVAPAVACAAHLRYEQKHVRRAASS